MAEITVAFDAGTSSSKVIASYPSGECPFNDESSFLIEPSVRQLTETTYHELLEYVEGGIGLDSSLVSYLNPINGERVYWEVGESASRPGLLFVNERKFETLLVKVLAFLGYLVDSSVKTQTQVQLNLGILLPLDEIEDRALLASWLRKIIEGQGFSINGCLIDNLCVNKLKLNCKPEGYGIHKSFPSNRTGVLVMGHSDLSWLFFKQGRFSTHNSHVFPGSGMHNFIKSLKFPVSYELSTAELIAKAGANLDPKFLVELTQTKSDDEIAHLTKAIKLARPQYWRDRQKEFEFLDIKITDQVCVAGGAANYFSAELTELFKEKYGIKLNWCKSLAKEFRQRFALKAGDTSIPLFLDCYGYFKTISQIKTVTPAVEKPKLEVVKSASS